jgi:glycosyltransferase involved in cell wall biosynthesis
MRVLVLTNLYPSPQRPAYGTFIRSQVESLRRASTSVDTLVIEGWRSRLEYIKAVGRLRKRIHSGNYDLLHAHYGLSAWVAMTQRRLPVVISFLGDDLLGTRREDGSLTTSSRIYAWINRWIASRSAVVIVKSEQMHSALSRDKWKKRIPVHVVPSGVDLGLFRLLGREPSLQHLGLEPGPLRVLFAANPAIGTKRHTLARRTVELLRKERNVELHTVWGRPQDEVVHWMNACDALLMTSWSEGSPNVVKEAMACNLPVVAVDVGDTGSLLRRCEGNVIVETDGIIGDPEALAKRMAEGLERVARAGRTECRAAMDDLSLEAVAEKIKGIYEEALASRER